MKIGILSLIIATLFFVADAQAQIFTFKGKTDQLTTVGGVGPNASDYVGAKWTGTSKFKVIGGEEGESKYDCAGMGQPPDNNIFERHGACTVTNDDGIYNMVVGCYPLNEDGSEQACLGGMTGISGAYEGRQGVMSFTTKGNTSVGSGHWN